MAFLGCQNSYPMRPANKGAHWASCDDFFNQYIDTAHVEFEDADTASNSLDGSNDNVGGDIKHLTDSTGSGSRMFSDNGFWTKTLQALQETAAGSGMSEQRERQASRSGTDRHHPDFLSLGGCPSPHLRSYPTSPSEEARRRKVSRRGIGHSSLIPGESTGISKGYCSGNRSPRTMTPSRYRAGFRDSWAAGLHKTPHRDTLCLPVGSMPRSPPASTKVKQEFCSPRDIDANPWQPFTHHGELISPFSSAFPKAAQVESQTPGSSPLTTPGVERGASFADFDYDTMQNPSMFCSPSASHRGELWHSPYDEDNCDLPLLIRPWTEREIEERGYQTGPGVSTYQPASSLQDLRELKMSGLMISCDPTLAPAQDAEEFGLFGITRAISPPNEAIAEAQNPQRSSGSRSPPMQHRRTSFKGHVRKTPSPRRVSSGAFVNYTASDKAKLLRGVAPSGSSKTKARREKEAAEKRRQFSQAAVKAVEEAGGNVTALRDVLI